nr:hypothetical protein CFP56_42242 [Quercus suber]
MLHAESRNSFLSPGSTTASILMTNCSPSGSRERIKSLSSSIIRVMWLLRRTKKSWHNRFNKKLHGKAAPLDDAEKHAYPVFPPPPPRQILTQVTSYTKVIQHRKFGGPIGETEDNPLFALFRMYEFVVTDDHLGLRIELEAFWWKPWPVASIPDPKDEAVADRYAVLSCIPALLVEAFNARMDLGLRRDGHPIMTLEQRDALASSPFSYEQVPAWTLNVAPLETTLCIPHRMPGLKQLDSLRDDNASPPFRQKNILFWHPHIHFV